MHRGLTIGEVGRRAGLRPSAIRYYESAGLLPAPPRTGGQRRYDESVLGRLGVVRLAQRAGFTVAEIRTLVGGFEDATPPRERWRALAARKLAELDELIERTRRMRALLERALACGCIRLEDCALILAQEVRDAPPPARVPRKPSARGQRPGSPG